MLLSVLLFSWNMGSPDALKGGIDMSAWADPIFQGEAPLLRGSLFYIFDRSNGELCLYDFAQGNGPEAPKRLWRNGGFGQGPGEFPEGYKINQIAFNSATQEIWVSHAFGFHVFNSRGSFVTYHKMNVSGGNRAWVSFLDGQTVFSAFNPLHERVIAQFAANSCLSTSHSFGQCIEKKVSHLHGIPVKSGEATKGKEVLLMEGQELYSYQGKLYHWDPILGEMVILSNNGDILNFISRLHFLVPNGEEEIQYTEKLHMTSYLMADHPQKNTGLVEAFGGLWTLIYSDKIAVVTHNTAGEQVFMNEEVLVKLDYDGQLQEMYRHPSFSQ
jgi:hypothetical protein